MPVGAIIGAAGAVAGGVASGKGASHAAQIQAQSAREQQALLKSIYNQNSANFQTDINAGDKSTARLMDLMGLSGNKVDPTSILRSTPGYQFQLGEALRGVNSNAYAAGLGNSGATQRALLSVGQGLADQTYNNYVNDLNTISNRGVGSKSALAGVSTNYANSSNAVNQNAADTAANYQMFKAANFNNTLQNVLKAGGSAFGSSFGGSGSLFKDAASTVSSNPGLF